MKDTTNVSRYMYQIKTIDSHTMGEPTRIVYEGFPELPGKTMLEKKNYLIEHYDFLRTALMLEPRGHRDMFGALLTTPVNEEADFGVIFMDSGGCLNMCGHGSIGAASMVVETGMVEVTEPYTEVVLDAPSGIIRAQVKVENGKAVQVSILNVPSFLYEKDLQINIPEIGAVEYDISFGGSFFALVDAEKIGLTLEMKNIEKITNLGMMLLDKINAEVMVTHPYLDITTVDLVEFYSSTKNPDADKKNCVVFGQAQVDRSPCGTGTSAKMAALYAKGEMKAGDTFYYESITGSIFEGEISKQVEVNEIKGIIPKITGSAYITGLNTWLLDESDPHVYGFLLGAQKEKETESPRNMIIQAAWQLFREKGYEETSMEDIVKMSGLDEKTVYSIFEKKDDLEYTLGELFDRKYADLMIQLSPSLSHYETLLYLNKELFKLIETEVPFALVRHIYMEDTNEKQHLLNSERFYYKLIPQIIEEGQSYGEFSKKENPEVLAQTYASLERGFIYDWCVKGGCDSLVGMSHKLLPIYLKELLVQ